MPEQTVMNLSPVADVKARQMAALRLPRSVVLDLEAATLEELRGAQMLNVRPDIQWAVLGGDWLPRLSHALANYRAMLEQHERERRIAMSVVSSVLYESHAITEEELPDPEPDPEPDHEPVYPYADWVDQDEVPF